MNVQLLCRPHSLNRGNTILFLRQLLPISRYTLDAALVSAKTPTGANGDNKELRGVSRLCFLRYLLWENHGNRQTPRATCRNNPMSRKTCNC
jgi:hypothetical protein